MKGRAPGSAPRRATLAPLVYGTPLLCLSGTAGAGGGGGDKGAKKK